MDLSRRTLLASAAMSSVLPQAFAQGASFPLRPVKLVVPSPAGGPLDVVARIVGQRLAELTGQPFVADARPGAGGSVGAKAVAQAEPTGYTLLAGFPSPIVVNPHLHANTGYTKADFASIGLICAGTMVLVVRAASPIKTVEELVALGKKPSSGFFASNGNGTMSHVCSAILNSAAGLTYGHIPYTGGPQAANALLAGDVTWSFMDAGNAKPLIADGRVRALGVSTKTRSSMWPAVPALAELGYKIDLSVWYGLLAPAKTPQAVIQKLNTLLTQVVKEPAIQATLRRLGFEPAADSSVSFMDKLLEAESGIYESIIQTARMKVE